jgi:hypothetical protein
MTMSFSRDGKIEDAQKSNPKVELKARIVCLFNWWMKENSKHGPVCAIQIVPEVEVANKLQRMMDEIMDFCTFVFLNCGVPFHFLLLRCVAFTYTYLPNLNLA